MPDCGKCALLMVLSVYDLPAFKAPPMQLGPPPILVVAGDGHFYRYAPDTPHRPPIPVT